MKQTEFVKVLGTLIDRGTPFVAATVIKTEGSSLGKPGFKVILSDRGEVLYSTHGGGCPESAIEGAAKKTMLSGAPRVVEVYLENVEDALVRLGKNLDFEVVVIDHSPSLSEQPDQLIQGADFDIGTFGFSNSDSVVVLTKGERDVGTLLALSKFKLRYVGLLASAKRANEDIAKLKEQGVEEELISRLRAPAGVDVGAAAPAEIALSIMAEVVAERHGKEVARKPSGDSRGLRIRP